MKKYIVCLALLVIFSCKAQEAKLESKPITISSNQVKEVVTFLSSDDIKGRDSGSKGIETSAKFLENKLKTFGVKPYFKTYRDSFKIKNIDAYNIVGYLEGNDATLKDEVIILSAHYDHIGYGKDIKKRGGRLTENDSIANGANDNASGTAAIVAMANYFAKKKNNKRSIMFVFFSAEERGLLGSKHLAEKLKDENINLYTMVNFEMIGVPLIDRDYEAFVSGYDLSNMADKINEYTSTNVVGFSEIAKKYNLFKASDNYPFYKHFNVACQSIASCDLSNYDYYHHVDDEADKMDYNHMANLINKIIPAIEMMSNTPTQEIKMHE